MKITQAFVREEENAGNLRQTEPQALLNHLGCGPSILQTWSGILWITSLHGSLAAMYLIGLLTLGPAVQVGTLIAIASYAWRFWQPILQLSNLYNTFINAVAYLERIFEMIDEPVTMDDAPDAYRAPAHYRGRSRLTT